MTTASETKMFGCTVAELEEQFPAHLTAQQLSAQATSILSDGQEMIECGNYDGARIAMNVGKWLLHRVAALASCEDSRCVSASGFYKATMATKLGQREIGRAYSAEGAIVVELDAMPFDGRLRLTASK